MKRLMLLAASALILATFVPQEADAQQGRGGVRGPGSGVVVGRGVRDRGGYRRGRGWGPAVGLGARPWRAGRRGRRERVRWLRRPMPSPAGGL